MFMYNPIGKTLAEIAKETTASFRGGYSVFVLQDETDITGNEIDMSYSVRAILENHPEIANYKVKFENDFCGITVLRAIKECDEEGKKLTDGEIIKALDNIQNHKWIFAKADNGDFIRIGDVADLINRQKAAIKRLTSGKCVYLSDDETTEYCVEGPCPNYKTEAQIKVEAYKECIEKVKDEKFKTSVDAYTDAYILGEDDLDNLLKELVPEKPQQDECC